MTHLRELCRSAVPRAEWIIDEERRWTGNRGEFGSCAGTQMIADRESGPRSDDFDHRYAQGEREIFPGPAHADVPIS